MIFNPVETTYVIPGKVAEPTANSSFQEYDFSFKICEVGSIDTENFVDVVSELRCYFVGKNKDGEVKERFYVIHLDTKNIQKENFIPFDKIDVMQLYKWIDSNLHPDNFETMKKSIHEQFHPPIRYHKVETFMPDI